jgi:hypothetical protein
MITFLPYPDFTKSAQSLDYRRLGKQRVEAFQILETLLGKSSSWINHPAVRMWRGHEVILSMYGLSMCIEWIRRGYNDSMAERFQEVSGSFDSPPWLGNEDLHRSHRSNLVRKDPIFYIPKFGNLPPEPYFWPL